MLIFIHEYVTGGGLAGSPLPASWAAEGGAIRRALVAEFAAVPGVEVVATLDARLDPAGSPCHAATRIITDPGAGDFDRLAAEADATLAVGPETGGVLLDLARRVERLGGRSLGSRPEAVELAADKLRLARHLEARGIPTPPTRPFDPDGRLPADWPGLIVVKPVDGAGAVDTWVVRDGMAPGRVAPGRPAIAQPFVDGTPLSASYLIGRDGRARLLAVGRQRIEVGTDGRIWYRGGVLPWPVPFDLGPVEAAVASVPGLFGFVGVDFIARPGGLPSILEINPRPTTSIVALARLRPPGALAAAWLDGAPAGPSRLGPARSPGPWIFDADGTIRSAP